MKLLRHLMTAFSCALIIFFSSFVVAASKDVVYKDDTVMDHFARGINLVPKIKAPLHGFTLPLDVYENVESTILTDIRVFNADEEIVPHGVELAPTEHKEKIRTEVLPFFPVTKHDPNPLSGIQLKLERTETTEQLELQTDATETVKREVWAYIIDATDLEETVHGLDLTWPVSEQFAERVTVSCSDDLNEWRSVLRSKIIASLRHNGNALDQSSLRFKPTRAKYFRLEFPVANSAPQISAISAKLKSTTIAEDLQWLKVTVTSDPDKTGRYLFDVPPSLSVQSLRIRAPQINTMARAEIFGRPSDSDSWRRLATPLVYHLEYEGGPIANTRVPIRPGPYAQYALQVDSSSGGFGRALPSVEIGWKPHTLVFLARGEAPFVLAYGGVDIRPQRNSVRSLMAFDSNVYRDGSGHFALPDVALGDPYDLGGDAARRLATRPIDWKTISLWATLIISVLVLGVMVTRLLRSLGPDAGTPVEE